MINALSLFLYISGGLAMSASQILLLYRIIIQIQSIGIHTHHILKRSLPRTLLNGSIHSASIFSLLSFFFRGKLCIFLKFYLWRRSRDNLGIYCMPSLSLPAFLIRTMEHKKMIFFQFFLEKNRASTMLDAQERV